MDAPALPFIEPSAHLKSIIDSAEDVIISKSLTGHIESWNPAAQRLFGYTAQEMIGRPMTVLMPEDRRDEEATILARIRRGEKVDHFETVRRCKNGRLVNLSVTISPIFDANGQVVGASKIARDISQRLRTQQLMWLQENYDNLTGMPNRRLFEQDLQQRLDGGGSAGIGVMVINLDRIKHVNDALGRQTGDQVIAVAAGRIREVVRDCDLVSRFGGDEFGVAMASDETSAAEVGQVGQRLLQVLTEAMTVGGEQVFISASLGIASTGGDGVDARTLIAQAELALHEAKRFGGGWSQQYSSPLEAQAQQRLKLATDLRLAVARDELFLLYQPIVDLRSGLVRKCEALLRWRHPEQGLVSPADFIPIAEQNGLIHEIGDWVLRQALQQVRVWQDQIDPGFQVSINMSPAQLKGSLSASPDWVAEVQAQGVAGRSLIVEITESMMLAPEMARSQRLADLCRAGIELAIDDFGTGYSSLSQLSRIDARYLKIDRSFIGVLKSDGKDLVLCRAIVAMAHALGLVVVAEGTETGEQVELLKAMGCDFAQGYFFARPMAAADLTRMAQAQPAPQLTKPA